MEHDILKTVILPYLNFVIFIILILIAARKPLKNIFKQRKEGFLSFLNSAEKDKNEASLQYKKLKEKTE